MSNKVQRLDKAHLIIVILVFSIFFLLTYLTPLVADDYNYAFGYASGVRNKNLHDIVDSMFWHRQLLNGRVFSHGWLSIVLMYPRGIFSLLNAMVAAFFTWTLLGLFQSMGCKREVQAVAAIWMLLWICMPGFGQVFFWTAGACNYFWGAAFTWFMVWRILRLEHDGKDRLKNVLLLILPAFTAGAWSEHISFAMLVTVFFLIIGRWMQKKHFPLAETIVFISGCLGYLYLMLAPATKLFDRLHHAGNPAEVNNLSHLLRLIGDARGGLFGFIGMLLLCYVLFKKRGMIQGGRILSLLFAVVSLGITICFAFRGWQHNGINGMMSSTQAGFFFAVSIYFYSLSIALKSEENSFKCLWSLVMTIGGFCGFALFAFGEYLPIRGFCAPVLSSILASVYLFECDETHEKRFDVKQNMKLVLVSFCFLLCFSLGVKDIISVHFQAVEREQKLDAAANGSKTVVLSPYQYNTKYSAQYGNPDLVPDADWPNGVMADYYEVIRIIVT